MAVKPVHERALEDIILGAAILARDVLSFDKIVERVKDTLNIESKVPSLNIKEPAEDVLATLLSLQRMGRIVLTSQGWKKTP